MVLTYIHGSGRNLNHEYRSVQLTITDNLHYIFIKSTFQPLVLLIR